MTRCQETSASVEAAFRKELAELLNRWGAEIHVDDHGDHNRRDLRTTVSIDAIYNDQNETVRPSASFDLGTYLNAGGAV